MSQGASGGLTRQKSRQSRKNANAYKHQVGVTLINKARRLAARKRWLLRRQSLEVRDRMNVLWVKRHPYTIANHTDMRYGLPAPTFHGTKESYNA